LTGVLAHYPLTDVLVRVVGGTAHPTDSSETAFHGAALLALREAAQAGQPALLEPIMQLEILTPEEHLGDVLGDVNSRRGRIRDIEAREAVRSVDAEVPLAELFGYATALRSLTKGRASYTAEPKTLDFVPAQIQNDMLKR